MLLQLFLALGNQNRRILFFFYPETGVVFGHLECLDVDIFFLVKLLFIQEPRKITTTKIQSSSWLGASCSLEKTLLVMLIPLQ